MTKRIPVDALPPYQPLPDELPMTTHVIDGAMVYLSGHIPDMPGHDPIRGQVATDLSTTEARAAARQVALNLLATLDHAAGGLDNVARVIRLFGMVNSAPTFTDQPSVINAASELIVEVLGRDRGLHSRSAVGVAQLPLGVPVEIELTARLHEEPT